MLYSTLLLPLALVASSALLSNASPSPHPTQAPAPARLDRRQIGLSLVSTGLISMDQVSVDSSAPSAGETTSAAGGASTTEELAISTVGADGAKETSSAEVAAASSATKQKATKATATELSAGAEATALAAPPAASPAPAAAAATEAKPNINTTVLNLALTLEKLEASFYSQALAKFNLNTMKEAGLSQTQAAIIIEEVTVIQTDEASHVKAIEGVLTALGVEPFQGCDFNFDAALTDAVTFLATARALEAVGVSAYLGAARLLTDPVILTAAASILTLEARHQSLLNTMNRGSYASQAFDIALGPESIFALAGGFLQNCQASDLGLVANAPLSATNAADGSTSFTSGVKLAFSSTPKLDTAGLSCHMFVGGAPVSIVLDASACHIPDSIDGPVAVFLTNNTTPMQSNLVDQDARGIKAGPALIFVDSKPSTLSTLFAIQGGDTHALASADMGALYAHKLESSSRKRDLELPKIVRQARSRRSLNVIEDAPSRMHKRSTKHRNVRGVENAVNVLGWS